MGLCVLYRRDPPHDRHAFDSPQLMRLGRILIFPVKSLDGLELSQARITPGGFLEHDRLYAIFDENGAVVNGKRTARIHQLRCAFDADFTEVRLWENGAPAQFCLDDLQGIDRWLGEFFGFPVHLKRDESGSFPDDRAAPGPTIVGTASLEAVAGWFPGLELEGVRRRFRTNMEIAGGESFCEDRLYGAPGELKLFRIGEVAFFGHYPCQRCVVPTREAGTGEPIPGFQKRFMEMRRTTLPAWANAKRFNHFYRFAVNTSVPPEEAGRIIRVGDRITI